MAFSIALGFIRMTPRIESLKSQVASIHEVALRRHRDGEDSRRVVQGLSDGMDGILRTVFLDLMNADVSQVALLAVGGYGRRELCPHSDIDLMFLRDPRKKVEEIERMVRLLWDSGFQLGHSVRTPEECLQFMAEDDVTAAALIEGRYIAGGESLMRRFQEVLVRYRKRHGEAFAQLKLNQLRSSVGAPSRTIFVTEPNLKEGACCLRDIQQIFWIERLRRGVQEIADLAGRGSFTFEEVRHLIAAYDFYLRVRCELHFVNGVRQDVLGQDSQPRVARGLGYCGAASEGTAAEQAGMERLMSDYYRHARSVLNITRQYLETGTRGTPFLSKIKNRLFSSRVTPYLSLLDGRLYLAEEPAGDAERLAATILEIFSIAQDRNAELSESLAGWIRSKLGEIRIDFAYSAEVDKPFLRILSGRGAGRVLTRMHETGVLGRILPEFEKLTCRVNFDGHHQFTVDEHTLRTLRELDQIESDPEYPEREFAKVLAGIPDRLPLRLALLLHDIGKSVTGKHDVRGTEAAVLICERLGLDESAIETVEFLIYLHLLMFRYSERRDFTDDRVVESLARLAERPDRLSMLYLLTYIDIRSVGPGTWTSWKGAQLADLYHRTRILLETGELRSAGKLEEILAAAGFDAEKQARILEHCGLMNSPSYVRETVPERMAYHHEMVERFQKTESAQIALDEQVGYSEFTFCRRDRSHLFADFAGVLLSEGLNILGARIFSRSDGIVIDLFQVETADRIQVDMPRRLESLRQKFARIERGEAQVADFVQERLRRFRPPPPRKALLPPRVQFDNEISETCTVIEVDAADRTGLLYDLATGISDLGLDLRAAKVSTLVDRAHDVFYVVEPDGRKVEDPARQEKIEQTLIAGAARAAPAGGVLVESSRTKEDPS